MELAIIITSSLTLIILLFSLNIYLTNEKNNKLNRENNIKEIKQAIETFKSLSNDTAKLQNEKIEVLANEVKLAQINSKLESNELKEKIELRLENILKEIKAPLDLD